MVFKVPRIPMPSVSSSFSGVGKRLKVLFTFCTKRSNVDSGTVDATEDPNEENKAKLYAYMFTDTANEKTASMFKDKTTNIAIYSVNAEDKRIEVTEQLSKDTSITEISTHVTNEACRLVVLSVPVTKGLAHKSVYAVIVWTPKSCSREDEVMYKAAMTDFCAQLPRYHCIFELTEWDAFGKQTVISKMAEISSGMKSKWR
ncbi:hypothetical protein IW138_006096 [Coemansia sp. RSA 986]|nr:hypothetical protein IW138_006096 [Coemansia sp. RSA 986]